MRSEAEDCRSIVGFIGADAFKHAVAVVKCVGEDVNLGVVPVDELAVHPYFLCGFYGHKFQVIFISFTIVVADVLSGCAITMGALLLRLWRLRQRLFQWLLH